MSVSTFNRLFRGQMGMSLGDYRLRIRMLTALELLAEGKDVARAALQVGYKSTSMFVRSFRQTLGTTPGRYFAAP